MIKAAGARNEVCGRVESTRARRDDRESHGYARHAPADRHCLVFWSGWRDRMQNKCGASSRVEIPISAYFQFCGRQQVCTPEESVD